MLEPWGIQGRPAQLDPLGPKEIRVTLVRKGRRVTPGQPATQGHKAPQDIPVLKEQLEQQDILGQAISPAIQAIQGQLVLQGQQDTLVPQVIPVHKALQDTRVTPALSALLGQRGQVGLLAKLVLLVLWGLLGRVALLALVVLLEGMELTALTALQVLQVLVALLEEMA